MNKNLTNTQEEIIEEEALEEHRLNKEFEEELKADYYDIRRWI